MLIAIRSTVASFFMKILFGILIASFAVWGVGDIFRGGFQADSEAATVGDLPITLQTLDREFQNELNRMQRNFGTELNRDQARALGLVDRSLQQLIVQALYRLEQDRLGMAVSDRQVQAWIADQSMFKDDLDRFDRLRFDAVLRQTGLTEAGFVATLRQDLARQQIIDSISSGFRAPTAVVEAIHAYRQETRIADTVLIANDTRLVAAPDDAAIRAHYDENSNRYTAPEHRAITYVAIESEDITGEIKVPEDEILAAYEDRLAQFTIEERRAIDQIVLRDEAAAQRAKTLLDQGRDFAEVAKELTGEADPGGLSLGTLNQWEFPLPDHAAAIFALDQGGVSAPLESPLGRHIFRVTKIEPGRVIPLDEVRQQLVSEIALERALDVMFELANNLQDELAGGARLEAAAGRLSLKASKLAGLERAGGLKDGATLPAIAAAPEFLAAAFDTPEGEESQLGETSGGGFFILRVDRVAAPAVRPLAEVRESVVAAVLAERREAAAETQADDILQAVKGGGDLAAAAGERGLELKTSQPFTRTGRAQGYVVPASLAAELFKASPGGVAMAPTANGFMVAQLKEVRAAPAITADNPADALSRSLDQAVRNDVLDQFAAALRGRYTVSVNQAAVDSLFRQQ